MHITDENRICSIVRSAFDYFGAAATTANVVWIHSLLGFKHISLRVKRIKKRQQKQLILEVLCGSGLGDGCSSHSDVILNSLGGHAGPNMGKCVLGGRSGSEAKRKASWSCDKR